jgi:hypothetical protein
MVSFNLSIDAENAVQLTSEALAKHRLRGVRNFDLRDALSTQDVPCPCPYHGTAVCDCNYVVLSVYSAKGHLEQAASLAGQILIHTHDGSTWLSYPGNIDGQNVIDDPDIDRRLLRALMEVVAGANASQIGEGNGA